jgi:hypothetical protein
MDVPFRIDFPAGSFAIVKSQRGNKYFGTWYAGDSNPYDEINIKPKWDMNFNDFDKNVGDGSWLCSKVSVEPIRALENFEFF